MTDAIGSSHSVSVSSLAEAETVIGKGAVETVDLNFPIAASEDLVQLVELGMRHRVSVIYRVQERIEVWSADALRKGLALPKDTFRARTLVCHFDMAELPIDERFDLEGQAAAMGDWITTEARNGLQAESITRH